MPKSKLEGGRCLIIIGTEGYVILDIFSRRVVGWCVADAENTVLFKALFDETFAKHGVSRAN